MNDRRSEQRYEINQPVLVTDLTRSEAAFPGLIVDISDRGMRLQIDRPLPLDTPLRVDAGDLEGD